MEVNNLAVYGAMVVAVSFYLIRRRARLAKED